MIAPYTNKAIPNAMGAIKNKTNHWKHLAQHHFHLPLSIRPAPSPASSSFLRRSSRTALRWIGTASLLNGYHLWFAPKPGRARCISWVLKSRHRKTTCRHCGSTWGHRLSMFRWRWSHCKALIHFTPHSFHFCRSWILLKIGDCYYILRFWHYIFLNTFIHLFLYTFERRTSETHKPHFKLFMLYISLEFTWPHPVIRIFTLPKPFNLKIIRQNSDPLG